MLPLRSRIAAGARATRHDCHTAVREVAGQCFAPPLSLMGAARRPDIVGDVPVETWLNSAMPIQQKSLHLALKLRMMLSRPMEKSPVERC